MIQYVTGIPGSGKTYYGLFQISIHFNTNLATNKKFANFKLSETKYKFSLTNINEVQFDKFENLKPLDFDKFKAILIKLHNNYKLGKSDSELEELVKDEYFFNTLIVLDECHNFLSKDDEVLVWWLSYHRHFFQDIILITQDLPLVHKKYKAFSEFYYKAIPASRKIFNTHMIYQQYIGAQMFKIQKSVTKKIPILKEVFELYGSGENNKQKSLVIHYLTIALILFIIFLIGGYFFINYMFGGGKPDAPAPVAPKQIENNKNNNQKKYTNEQIFYMLCNFQYCFVNNNIFDKTIIFEILKNDYNARFIANSTHKYIFFADDKYQIFNQRIKKETNESSTSMLDGFGFSNK